MTPRPRGCHQVRAVLFDLDDTLLDRAAGFERFCRELYHSCPAIGQKHTEEEALALMLALDAQGQRPRPDMFRDFMAQWPGVFRDVDQAMQVFLTLYPRMLVLDPQTRELLEDLQDSGIPCAIVTNGGASMQMNKVREAGLDGLVKAIVISEALGVAKPDRRIFEHALAQIGALPSTAMFVGDNPENDILGALGLGMCTAWLHHGRQWPHAERAPDYVIDSVSQVRHIVLAGA